LHRSAQVNMWVGLLLSFFLGYISYLFIRLIYDEIRTMRYTIKDAEIIDLSLLILIFAVLALMMIWYMVFAFRWMFLSYRKKAIKFKKDRLNDKKEIIRGFLINTENRRQGFDFRFENGEIISLDFNYLITGGYKIIDSTILTHTEIEISRLPHSFLSFGIRYIHFPEQKQELPSKNNKNKEYSVAGIVTFAFIFEVGLKYKYKGIVNLDRPQLLIQIGDQPLRLAAGELPQPGSQNQQRLNEITEIDL